MLECVLPLTTIHASGKEKE